MSDQNIGLNWYPGLQHVLIRELFRYLPPPQGRLTPEKRARFLEALELNMDLVWPDSRTDHDQ